MNKANLLEYVINNEIKANEGSIKPIIEFLDEVLTCVFFINESYEIIAFNKLVLTVFNARNIEEVRRNFIEYMPDKQCITGEYSYEYFKCKIDDTLNYGVQNFNWCTIINGDDVISKVVSLPLELKVDNQKVVVVMYENLINTLNIQIQVNKNVDQLKKIMDVNPLCVNLWDSDFNNIFCNKKAVELFDLNDEQEYLDRFFELSPKFQPDNKLSSKSAVEFIKEAKEKGHVVFYWMHCRLNGDEIPCEITLSKIDLKDKYGNNYIAGFTRDLSNEFVGLNKDGFSQSYFVNLISDKLLLDVLSKLSTEWFFMFDLRTRKIKFFGEGSKIVNIDTSVDYDFETLDNVIDIVSDHDMFDKNIDRFVNGEINEFEAKIKCKDEKVRYFKIVGNYGYDKDNNPIFLIGKVVDIHNQKIVEIKATTDPLTGCYNRATCEALITESIYENPDSAHAFFIIDIDNFKAVNDNLGHYVGDLALKEVANNLKDNFRSNDIIARIGGDEFVLFTTNTIERKDIEKKAIKILEIFSKEFIGDNTNYEISGSVGIATYPDHGYNYDELYKSADKAMYKAKNAGKNRYYFYGDNENLIESIETSINDGRVENRAYGLELLTKINEIFYESKKSELFNNLLKYILEQIKAKQIYILKEDEIKKSYFYEHLYETEVISNNEKNIPVNYLNSLIDYKVSKDIICCGDTNLIKDKVINEMFKVQNIGSVINILVECNDENYIVGANYQEHSLNCYSNQINTLLFLSKLLLIYLKGIENGKIQ